MKTFLAISCAAMLSLSQFAGDTVGATGGDRGHDLNKIYPDRAFLENGGPIIDLTRPPYNAKGSGDPEPPTHGFQSVWGVS